MMALDIRSFQAYDGAEIKYVDVGQGTPVVYIYGIGSSIASSEPFIDAMKNHCRFIVFDQRSFGITPAAGEIGIHQSARDASALIEHLGLEDVILFGYSMGAACVFSYIRQFGCKHLKKVIIGDMSPKLINEDGWNLGLYQGHYTREMYQADLELIKTDYRRFALILTEQLMFKSHAEEPRDFSGNSEEIYARIQSKEHNPLVLQALMAGLVDVQEEHQEQIYHYWETMAGADFRDILKDITVPTALLHADPGSGYQPATAAYMKAQIPDATMMPVENCSHMAAVENPTRFRQYLFDFVEK
jgi:non-heme chloroperoxidase